MPNLNCSGWRGPANPRTTGHGKSRWRGLAARSLGIGRNVLTQRLKRLVEEGMLDRVRYQEKPDRYEYVLTDKGRDFYPVVLAMAAWGDRWLNGPAGPPIVLHHGPCGHTTEAKVVCAHCDGPLELGDVKASLGPGYQFNLPFERPGVGSDGGPRR